MGNREFLELGVIAENTTVTAARNSQALGIGLWVR
jgi:hypothetical protein